MGRPVLRDAAPGVFISRGIIDVAKTREQWATETIIAFCADFMGIELSPIRVVGLLAAHPEIFRRVSSPRCRIDDAVAGTIADAVVDMVMAGQPIPINQTRWTWPDVESTIGYRLEFYLEFERVAREHRIPLLRGWF